MSVAFKAVIGQQGGTDLIWDKYFDLLYSDLKPVAAKKPKDFLYNLFFYIYKDEIFIWFSCVLWRSIWQSQAGCFSLLDVASH